MTSRPSLFFRYVFELNEWGRSGEREGGRWIMDYGLTEDESRVGLLEAREVPKVRGLAELVASRVCGEGG